MATSIDELQIQISAQIARANKSLGTLINKLKNVSSSLSNVNSRGLRKMSSGISSMAAAMNRFSADSKTADFSKLARSVSNLSSVNASGLLDISKNVSLMVKEFNKMDMLSDNSAQIGVLASNISKMGGKNVSNAISNLPKLSEELNKFMSVMANSPQVNQNIIDMTNALANLAGQGRSINAATNGLSNGLSKNGSVMQSTSRSSVNLALSFGKLYAAYRLVVRGVEELSDSVKSSMDYLEVLNYFNKAWEQVGKNADLSNWKSLGYESAEAYANSFEERAKQLTQKLTGFTVSPSGALQSTGMTSLGINPSEVMQYQAMFGQMASSMGVTSDTAVQLSNVLTQIGADLASVRNMDFEDVWTDMASGLAGMSRTLDKYGTNIRNVNLQQKLLDLGIDANIQSLNQDEKALLRVIILLESTEYAWGDLSETLEQPANQLRLLSANFENLSRTIGGLFLPLVQKALPYINGIVIALQRMFASIGTMLGIDLSGITSSVGDTDFSNVIENADDLDSALEGVLQTSEKLRKNLRSFDELNVISMDSGIDTDAISGVSGIGGGVLDQAFLDAASKYQEEWNKAFANVENKAQEFADRIESFFVKIASSPIIQSLISIFDSFFGGISKGFKNAKTDAETFNNVKLESISNNINTVKDNAEKMSVAFSEIAQAFESEAFVNINEFFAKLADATLLNGLDMFTGAMADLTSQFTTTLSYNADEFRKTLELIMEIASNGLQPLEDLLDIIFFSGKDYESTWFHQALKFYSIINTGAMKNFLEMVNKGLRKIAEISSVASAMWRVFFGRTALLAQDFFSEKRWIEWGYGMVKGFAVAIKMAIAAIKAAWNMFAKQLNKMLTIDFEGFSKEFEIFGQTYEIGIPAFEINLGKIPTFAQGGFPEDGFFFANHTELVGQFGNGRTAVANNDQITQGIANAVYPAVKSAMSEVMSRFGNQPIRVYVGDRELTEIVVDGINDMAKPKQKLPFNYLY